MAPRQSYEDIFQTGLPRGQTQKLTSLPFHFVEQSGNRQVQFLHVECYQAVVLAYRLNARQLAPPFQRRAIRISPGDRSEEHTSELQSHLNLVCRLLLEKKKNLLY